MENEASPGRSDHKLITKSGYELQIVRSALQKCLRRGLEREAMYWGLELGESGYLPYLIRTLFTIVHEDVGFARSDVASSVKTSLLLWHLMLKEHGRKVEWKHVLASVVLQIARSRKHRVCDDLACVVIEQRRRGLRLEPPDFAYDSHVRHPRSEGRHFLFWNRFGSVVVPKATPDEIGGPDYEEEAQALWAELAKDTSDWREDDPRDPESRVHAIPRCDPSERHLP